ncbi:YbhB/YbcL family Raf kinase inhibitor-like protein [Oligoflexus tunisiensis]|uniref:YbhB/YbcL family Raf kinase inhibitor-like protein n=1 Tax=Oligoflexus tunisiensis TaxID=708132 RepID=UPI00114CD945|nr:YbhB/YbcL family Raf kinase inhibitor-like protein [Oligoflexus tunisiensis]
MKNASVTVQVLYSSLFLCALGCSSAAPTAPVTKRGQAPATATTSGDASQKTSETNTDNKAADTAATPQDEEKTETPATTPPAAPQALELTSTAFANMGAIPVTYVAKGNGGNQSPPLQWKNPPAGTGSFAIQMVDLDFLNPAPAPFIHWMITNIPATTTQLPAAIPGGNNLAAPAEALGANQMKNYAGPNPPNLHRYEWTIYAIKQGETLNLTNNSMTNKTELEAKSLGKATLIGTYQ